MEFPSNVRMWRNWQTRMVQVHVPARVWRFKSSHPHQVIENKLVISVCIPVCIAWNLRYNETTNTVSVCIDYDTADPQKIHPINFVLHCSAP